MGPGEVVVVAECFGGVQSTAVLTDELAVWLGAPLSCAVIERGATRQKTREPAAHVEVGLGRHVPEVVRIRPRPIGMWPPTIRPRVGLTASHHALDDRPPTLWNVTVRTGSRRFTVPMSCGPSPTFQQVDAPAGTAVKCRRSGTGGIATGACRDRTRRAPTYVVTHRRAVRCSHEVGSGGQRCAASLLEHLGR